MYYFWLGKDAENIKLPRPTVTDIVTTYRAVGFMFGRYNAFIKE